jgi:hypothetical protein
VCVRGLIASAASTRGSFAPDPAFDFLERSLGALRVAVYREPARAFRDESAREQNEETERSANSEADAPADVDGKDARVEQNHRCRRSRDRPEPEAAVDDEVHASAHARRYELVDRRIDRRVLAPDTEAGDRAAQRKAREVPGKGREHRAAQVDAHRDEKKLRSPVPVGELAEYERADDRAEQIRRRGEPDLGW